MPASRRTGAVGEARTELDPADAVLVLSEEGRMLGLGRPDGDGGLKPKVVFEARG